jgi:uncharacterized protein (DUF427 family)
MREDGPVSAYPPSITPQDHRAPVPRRIRARKDGRWVVDTTGAVYVWEMDAYPQYYLPVADVDPGLLADPEIKPRLRRDPVLPDHVRIRWDALDEWFEEDEEVFVHPRNPYARVDAVRSTRQVRIELGGVVLAESRAPVMVFETGLPPRLYLERSGLHLDHLEPSPTRTACPYKGRTTAYWSARIDGALHEDVAWCYDFPTAPLLPIAGLVAFYDEKVDTFLDGVLQKRPVTAFS